MRVQDLEPIGQGCKPARVWLDVDHKKSACRCQIHFWRYLNICLGCGEKFHTARPETKTCSDKCRKRLSRSRHDKMFQRVMQFAEGGAS